MLVQAPFTAEASGLGVAVGTDPFRRCGMVAGRTYSPYTDM